MVKTMETVKRIRPKASWGFYMFPYKLHGPCHRAGGEVLCGSDDGEWGRKVSELYTADWLLPAWRAVDAIFPSIYLSKGVSADHQTAYVKVRLLRSTCTAHNLSAASVPSAICAPQSSVTSSLLSVSLTRDASPPGECPPLAEDRQRHAERRRQAKGAPLRHAVLYVISDASFSICHAFRLVDPLSSSLFQTTASSARRRQGLLRRRSRGGGRRQRAAAAKNAWRRCGP